MAFGKFMMNHIANKTITNNNWRLDHMNIEYGNLKGQYFTQWRIDLLKELLDYVVNGFAETQSKIEASDVKIWYDPNIDFHILQFKANDQTTLVRFYKVFSCWVNGEELWIGCPRNEIVHLANIIRKRIT